MSSDLDSKDSTVGPADAAPMASRPSSWLKVGAIAAASAIAGGLAAAWFYRKTLAQFHQASVDEPNPEFRYPGDDSEEDA